MLMKTLPLYLQDQSHPQAQVCQSCEVRRGALFGALDMASLERIHAHIAAPALQPGDRVFARGEKAAAVYTVRAGIVRFERVTTAGERLIVRLAGKGDLIGQEALLHQPYTDEAVACTPVQLCRIPTSLVDDLGRDQASLLLELMRRWQQALDQAESWMSELAAGSARHRVLRLLALLQRHTNDQGWIWLPRRDEMGAMLCMTVETASRMVSQLRREGVLQLLPPLHAQLDAGRLAHALQQQDLA